MALRICPGCKQNADRDLGFCSICGYDFVDDRAESYNRTAVFWMRVTAVLCAVVAVTAVRSTGRRPDYNDYRDMMILQVVPAVLIWGVLKLIYRGSQRKLWVTALIPSFLIVAGVFAWRAWQSPNSSLSLAKILNATYAERPATPPATPAATPSSLRALFDRPDARTAASTSRAAEPANEFATLIPIASDCYTFMRKQPDFIVSEMTGGGVEKMLAPTTLENRKQLDASRARIRKLQDRLADYDARIRKKAADLTARVQASAAPEKVKAKFLGSVRRSGGDLVRGVLEFVALNRKTLTTTDQMLEFLRSRSDRFTVVHKRPMFADAADGKKYEELRKQLDDLSDQVARVGRFVRAQGEQAIRDLDLSDDGQSAGQLQASGGS
jgi:hypothetical protein